MAVVKRRTVCTTHTVVGEKTQRRVFDFLGEKKLYLRVVGPK